MSSFRLSDGQLAYARWIRDVAKTHLRPLTEKHDGRVNRPLLRAMGELGLLRGLFGGTPGDAPTDAAAMQLCLLRESLAQVSGEAETALALQGLGSYPILQSGSDALRTRWLPPGISGEAVGAFSVTHPDAGSHAATPDLRAVTDGD